MGGTFPLQVPFRIYQKPMSADGIKQICSRMPQSCRKEQNHFLLCTLQMPHGHYTLFRNPGKDKSPAGFIKQITGAENRS
jgi:hypothetical protein